MKLTGVKALLIDVDGTLAWRGQAIDGASEVMAELRQKGFSLRFLTNMDSQPPAAIAQELRGLGIEAKVTEVFNPACAALAFLRAQPEKSCFCLVSDALEKEFAEVRQNSERPDFVLVGDVRDKLTYEMLNRAYRCIDNGAEIVALQKGRFFVTHEGVNLDTGAFVQLLEYASGKTARVLGKPSADFFRLAMDDLGVTPDEVVVIGDDVTIDVVGAKRAAARTVLVRTGKFTTEALSASPEQPDLVVDSITEVPDRILME